MWQKRRHLSGNGMSVGSVADPDLYYVKKFESGSVWRDNKSGSRPYTVNEQKHAMAKRVGGLLITFKLTTDKLITKIYKLITYKKLFYNNKKSLDLDPCGEFLDPGSGSV